MDVRLKAFRDAAAGLDYLVHLDIPALRAQWDERLIDGLQNGMVQKFEYTLELCWKALKAFLKAQEGIDEASPKKVIKAFYLAGHLCEDDYLLLIQAVDDRNRLSHVYDQQDFHNILERLLSYAELFNRVAQQLTGNWTE